MCTEARRIRWEKKRTMSIEERVARVETEVRNLKDYMKDDMATRIDQLCSKIDKRFMQMLKLYVSFILGMMGLISVLIVMVMM